METERSSALDWIHLHPLLKCHLCSMLVGSESWPLWTIWPVISCLLPLSGTWPLGQGDVSGDECGRAIRVFLLTSVLLPSAVLAVPTPLCDGTWSLGTFLIYVSHSQWDPVLLPPLAPLSPGWLRSHSWLICGSPPYFGAGGGGRINFLKPSYTSANSSFIKHFQNPSWVGLSFARMIH